MPTPQQRRLLLNSATVGPSSLLTSLVAYYSLEEASGTRADATGRGNDVSPTNTPGNTTGKVGNALSLVAASTQYLGAASTSDLVMGNIDFTIAFWINFTTFPTNVRIVNKCAVANNEEYYMSIPASDKLIRFGFSYSSGAWREVSSSVTCAASTWYFAIGWHDSVADTINCQVNNGTVASSATSGSAPQTAAGAFRIGAAAPAAGSYVDGIIDEVGIWKRVLTSTERATLYNAGSGRAYPFTGT